MCDLLTFRYLICIPKVFGRKSKVKNTDQIIAIKRRVLGFLAPADIREIRERHGMTLEEAAAVFGNRAKTFAKFEIGQEYPSIVTGNIIRIFDVIPEDRILLLSGC